MFMEGGWVVFFLVTNPVIRWPNGHMATWNREAHHSTVAINTTPDDAVIPMRETYAYKKAGVPPAPKPNRVRLVMTNGIQ